LFAAGVGIAQNIALDHAESATHLTDCWWRLNVPGYGCHTVYIFVAASSIVPTRFDEAGGAAGWCYRP